MRSMLRCALLYLNVIAYIPTYTVAAFIFRLKLFSSLVTGLLQYGPGLPLSRPGHPAAESRDPPPGLPSSSAPEHTPYLWRCPPRGLGASAPSIILAGKNQCQRAPQPRGSAHSLEGPNRRHRDFLTSVPMGKFWLESIA